ncbi:hypothetical protein DXU93_08850 [Brumimicrobium aurantiacum]|uniref:Uncharacterized protein n=1 Tax=Brumimicrobium aurantiacum TaxID=1737063 RepID=A0A3E1EX12_9FLAO|nr:hypothetical protein DXU93_08850 [Brumimicrobium aurantiacum]
MLKLDEKFGFTAKCAEVAQSKAEVMLDKFFTCNEVCLTLYAKYSCSKLILVFALFLCGNVGREAWFYRKVRGGFAEIEFAKFFTCSEVGLPVCSKLLLKTVSGVCSFFMC